MSLFGRITSSPEHVNADEVLTQPPRIIEVVDAAGLLVTVDTTHWPAGWDDDIARTRVPAELLAYYRRGGNHESVYARELLTISGHTLTVYWGDSDTADLDVNHPQDRVLALHSMAMQAANRAYAAAVIQHDQDTRNRAQYTCGACGGLVLPPHVDAVEVVKLPDRIAKVHLCRQCRSVAYDEAARTLGAELLPDGRTRGEAVREIGQAMTGMRPGARWPVEGRVVITGIAQPYGETTNPVLGFPMRWQRHAFTNLVGNVFPLVHNGKVVGTVDDLTDQADGLHLVGTVVVGSTIRALRAGLLPGLWADAHVINKRAHNLVREVVTAKLRAVELVTIPAYPHAEVHRVGAQWLVTPAERARDLVRDLGPAPVIDLRPIA